MSRFEHEAIKNNALTAKRMMLKTPFDFRMAIYTP